jgi:hypothetical protein
MLPQLRFLPPAIVTGGVAALAALLLCALAGCAHLSEVEVAALNGGEARALAEESPMGRPKRSAAEETQMAGMVYANLLARRNFADGEYSAIFVKGSAAEVAALMRQFPNHIPKIKPLARLQLVPNRTPIDLDTGKSAVLLGVSVGEAEEDRAEAVATVNAGPLMSSTLIFGLRRVKGQWGVESID